MKIKSSVSRPSFRHQHCVLSVAPPPFHGLVIQLLNGYSPSLVHHHCDNYIEIFSKGEVSEKFCNFSSDTGVSRIFATTKKVEILVNIAHARKHSHVSMMFTAYDKRLYTCEPEKFQCTNSLCLWKGFVCDGENNCGDLSDEQEHGKSKCGMKTKGWPMFHGLLFRRGIIQLTMAIAAQC